MREFREARWGGIRGAGNAARTRGPALRLGLIRRRSEGIPTRQNWRADLRVGRLDSATGSETLRKKLEKSRNSVDSIGDIEQYTDMVTVGVRGDRGTVSNPQPEQLTP